MLAEYTRWLATLSPRTGWPQVTTVVALCLLFIAAAATLAWPAAAQVRRTGSWAGDYTVVSRHNILVSHPVKAVLVLSIVLATLSCITLGVTLYCWQRGGEFSGN